MKFAVTLLILLLPAIAAVVMAGFMALHDKSGWGWMLFVGLILGGRGLHMKG